MKSPHIISCYLYKVFLSCLVLGNPIFYGIDYLEMDVFFRIGLDVQIIGNVLEVKK